MGQHEIIAGRRRAGRAVAAVSAIALGLGGLTAAAVPAYAEAPEGARFETFLEAGSQTYNPANALSTGRWGHEGATGLDPTWITPAAVDANGELDAEGFFAAADCADGDFNRMRLAWVPTSANPGAPGSAERPAVEAGETLTDAFTWAGQALGDSVNPPAVGDRDGTRVNLATKAELEAGTGGVDIAKRWPAGELISLVVVCTTGVSNEYHDPIVEVEDGYAKTLSWLTFRTAALPERPDLTSARYEVLGAKVTPLVTLTHAWTGGRATLTATVAGESGTALTDAPGTVSFYTGVGAGRRQVGEAAVSASGTASVDVTELVPAGGATSFEAVYTPDAQASARYQSATSSRHTVLAAATGTTTALAVAGTLRVGTTQTLTATVTPSSAVGKVVFLDGSATLGQATVSGGKATLNRALAAGRRSLTARFEPSDAGAYTGSVSPAKIVTIASTAVTTTRLSVAGPRTAGLRQVLTAVVAPAARGTVEFRDGSRLLGRSAVTGGRAVRTVSLSAGRHQVNARFIPADAQASASSAVPQVVAVAKQAPRLSVKATPATVRVRRPSKLAVTVGATGVKASGKITVQLKGKAARGLKRSATRFVVSLGGSGRAVVRLPKLTRRGSLVVVVRYAGNANLLATSKRAAVRVR